MLSCDELCSDAKERAEETGEEGQMENTNSRPLDILLEDIGLA